MARNPAGNYDPIRAHLRQREQVRGVRIRPRAHTESKTFIVGAVTDGIYIPPYRVGINADDNAPEWKYLHSVRSNLGAGTCDITWKVNGSTVASQSLSTVAAGADVSPVVELAHDDEVSVEISAASSAMGLSATFIMVTSPS